MRDFDDDILLASFYSNAICIYFHACDQEIPIRRGDTFTHTIPFVVKCKKKIIVKHKQVIYIPVIKESKT